MHLGLAVRCDSVNVIAQLVRLFLHLFSFLRSLVEERSLLSVPSETHPGRLNFRLKRLILPPFLLPRMRHSVLINVSLSLHRIAQALERNAVGHLFRQR
jgi:hypothetical protein